MHSEKPLRGAAAYRSQHAQTDIPYVPPEYDGAVAGPKVYMKVVFNDKMLLYKLSNNCALRVLFAKLDVKGDFSWEGIILDPELTPQHYNMLPGEENAITVTVVRNPHQKLTHSEEIVANGRVRAMAYRLRLEEERSAQLAGEVDDLGGQLSAVHRELKELSGGNSLRHGELKNRIASLSDENIRLEESSRHIQHENATLNKTVRDLRQALDDTSSVAGQTQLHRQLEERDEGIAVLKQTVARLRLELEHSQKPAVADSSVRSRRDHDRQQHMKQLEADLGDFEKSHSGVAGSGREVGGRTEPPSAQPGRVQAAHQEGIVSTAVRSGHVTKTPPPPTVTIRCSLLDEATQKENIVDAVRIPEPHTIKEALKCVSMLGYTIPPQKQCMLCVQKGDEEDYTVVDLQKKGALSLPLRTGDTLYVGQMV